MGGETGRCDPEHLERSGDVSHAFPRSSGGNQTRRLAGGRVPGRDSGDEPERNVHEADLDVLSQSAGDGGGGDDSLPSDRRRGADGDRKSTRLNSSHQIISYAVFCLKKKKTQIIAD